MTTDKLAPYRVEDDDFYLSLTKLYGKKIADIHGYIGDPYGGGPTFGISQIVFEDGEKAWVDGEHDWAYVYGHPLFEELADEDDDTL